MYIYGGVHALCDVFNLFVSIFVAPLANVSYLCQWRHGVAKLEILPTEFCVYPEVLAIFQQFEA